jgi:hypothetical protein
MSEHSTPAPVVYKPVADFPGYRVGDDGSVWSRLPQIRGGGSLLSEWRRLKPVPRRGYLRVGLRSHVGSKLHWRSVHRVVLEAFVGPCPEGMECCHRDGNKKNNALGNIRWDTPSANTYDKYGYGKMVCGSRTHWAKLTEADIPEIKRMHAEGLSQREIGRRLGVNHMTIGYILRGKSWKHV